MIVSSPLTVGALRRVLTDLDDDLPIGVIRLLALADASVGRVDAAEVVDVHVSHHDLDPVAVWLWCRADPLGVTTPASDLPLPAALDVSRPQQVLVRRTCGCVLVVPIEHELVHLDASACPHQRANDGRLYAQLLRRTDAARTPS